MKLFKTAALAVAVSMIGLSIVSDAAAVPAQSRKITYYSSAAAAASGGVVGIVGGSFLACSGNYQTYGAVTDYHTIKYTSCSPHCTNPNDCEEVDE
ncbi:hypothetical protein [Asticcacaulis sp.]|uniref:hypothetical protein n=1 Tax=Asticcacaulis sp. TaxID=1872648 RepID=UPI002B89927E|nr:hypothetical protein [Asticcacaulis sp.]HTM83057.1 hypothetical protein [Asticcacaulis sp.]